MDNEIVVNEVSCPKCGGHTFTKGGVEKGLYACTAPRCYAYAFYCKTCDKIYPENNIGKHGDVYECKTCGSVHWGYTDMKRAREEAMSMLMGAGSKMDSILNRLK